jgi:hypothetical protein
MVMLRPHAHTVPIRSGRLAEGTPVAMALVRFCRKRLHRPLLNQKTAGARLF